MAFHSQEKQFMAEETHDDNAGIRREHSPFSGAANFPKGSLGFDLDTEARECHREALFERK